ncbi:MAG: hypothetical protein A3F63_16080 [Pseudomonadales bacterium RIFCSPHIGHO2_12_FULL_40_16]|jgi:hypothetical protein|uniref:hypothetical protein n=1 Tax=Acinetobacter johnsonii TaxID=40214 RepID=UPI0008D5AC96|nr:hypothetical protein [Acinetobacter johnsonii]OFW72256.1 MAG: hypothetical protein A2W44_04225 [Acinetobacter sp. RIFCSPHIGHO2_12_41_5]OHC20287.1 MAG: hypothetical protein A3F63_16080 [Pseudomonadales bacterium RIFCSPHIGHO2_12_FULL_40_16]USI87851.1 hypothetical protein LZ086_07650 [Acinetobacter johnsonii]
MQVCKVLSTANEQGLQTCLEWVEYSHPLAITKAEMVQIGGSLLAVAAVFIAYAIIAKAVNSL